MATLIFISDEVTFNDAGLSGETSNNPTALMFSRSGEPVLFVAQVDGTIKRYVVEKQLNGTFDITKANTPSQTGAVSQDITTVKDTVENYDDEGNIATGNQTNERQITGLVTTVEVIGDTEYDVLYVSSSDRRHGGGGDAEDKGVDPNSGQIHKLIVDKFSGAVVDSYAVIRGLPRSSENHSTNGIDLTVADNGDVIMYIAQGANTNKGAPSNNFVGFIDSALSGTILKVNLTELESYDIRTGANGEKFILDLPTLNDPGRADVDLSTLNIQNLAADPLFSMDVAPGSAPEWAGSSDKGNSTNSAKITSHVLVSEGGQLKLVENPMSVFQPGYRNHYDVHVTEDGEIVSWDNGPNSGWGGQPIPLVDQGGSQNYVEDWTTELATNDFNETGSSTFSDWLHVAGKVDDEFGPYAGFANPVRAAVEAIALAFDQSEPLYVDDGTGTLIINPAVYNGATSTTPIHDYDGTTVLFTGQDQALDFLSRLTPHYDEQPDGSWVDVRPDGPGGYKLMPIDLHTVVAGYDWTSPGSSISDPTKHFDGTDIAGDTAFSPEAELMSPSENGGLIKGGTSSNGLTQYTAGSWFDGALDGAIIVTAFGGAQLQFVDLLDTNGDTRSDDAEEIGTISDFGSQPLSVQALGDNGLSPTLIDNDNDGIDDFSGTIWAATYGADNITTFVPGGTPTDPSEDADSDGIDDTQDTHAWAPDNGEGVIIGSFFGPNEGRWHMELSSNSLPPGAATTFGPAPDAGIVAAWKNGVDPARDGGLYDGENFDIGGASSFLSIGTAPVGSAEGPTNNQKDALAIGAILAQALDGALITAEMLNVFDYQVNADNGASWDGGEKVGIFLGPDQSTFLQAAIVVQSDGSVKLELYTETDDANGQSETVDLVGVESPLDVPNQDSVIQIGFILDFGAQTTTARARYQNPNLDGDPSTADADWSDWVETAALPIPVDVLASLYGDYVNFGNESGATIGMFANAPQGDDSFAASWDYVEIVGVTDGGPPQGGVLYRWNAGDGDDVAAIDGGPDWLTNIAPIVSGSTNNVSTHNITTLDASVPAATTPVDVFTQERWDGLSGGELELSFNDTTTGTPIAFGSYTVRVFMGDGASSTAPVGARVYDMFIEGEQVLDDFDSSAVWGPDVGGMIEWTGLVTDGSIDIAFQREVENPQVNAVEIIAHGSGGAEPVVSVLGATFAESDGTTGVTIETNVPIPTDETVTVDWEVRAIAGGATPEVDFTVPGGSFVDTGDGLYQGQSEIAGDSSDVTIPITITDDTDIEGDELFEVVITNVSGAGATIGTGTASVTIEDNDAIMIPDDVAPGVAPGDFSDDPDAPTASVLAAGENTLVAAQEGFGGDLDYVTVTVPDGHVLSGIALAGFDDFDPNVENAVFVGLAEGSTFPFGLDSAGPDDSTLLLGGAVVGESDFPDDTDLLARFADGVVEKGGNAPTQGFEGPLEAGTYTFGFSQNQGASAITMNLTVQPVIPGVYLPNENGDFVFEAEAADDPGPGGYDFKVAADLPAGHEAPTGDGYVLGTSNHFSSPDGEVLRYPFMPDTDGFIRVNLVASRETASETTEENDSWTALQKDGVFLTAEPYEGSLQQKNGFYKTYSSGGDVNDWIIAAKNVDGQGKPIGFAVEAGEIYDFLLSVRSEGHEVDRIMLQFSETPFEGGASFNGLADDFQAAPLSPKSSDIVVPVVGEAVLSINEDRNNIETSNFADNSFKITNTGDKNIEAIEIDVTDALLPDAVFDPFKLAGDLAGKILTIDTEGGTGVVTPPGGFDEDAIGITYIGEGGVKGYEKIRLDFTDFDPGETIGFSIDMDPNSIAGAAKGPLDDAAVIDDKPGDDTWDVGGVSGAELIHSLFTVTYDDDTASEGRLQGQGTGQQSGAKALSTQAVNDKAVALTVNGLGAGQVGFYTDGGPTVTVEGAAGETARVVLAKGFTVPFFNPFTSDYGDQFDAQMAELAASRFPANNVAEFQYVDIALDGTVQDITALFDFTDVDAFTIPAQYYDEAELPLGFAASVIDTTTDLSQGPVTPPIHLIHSDNPLPVISLTAPADATETGDTGTVPMVFTATVSDPAFTDTIEVTYTETIDGTSATKTATLDFSAGAPTITVEVPNDDIAVGDRVVSVALVSTTASDVVISTAEVSATVADDDSGGGGDDFRVEAEDLTIEQGFEVTSNGNASGGVYLQADAPGEQRASFVFDGADGVYDIGLGHFDENDGQSIMEVLVNGVVVDSFTWDVDAGGSLANSSSFVERTITGVTLRDGDVVAISGFEDGGEPLRTDYLDFSFTGSTGGDTAAPVVQSADAPDVAFADAGTPETVVTVTYADDVALDVATVDVTDISVTGPGGALTVTGASVDQPSDGTPRTVSYTVAAPGGTWDPADDGAYDVALAAGAVADTSGNAIAADPALASFAVSTTPPPPVLSFRVEAETLTIEQGFEVVGNGNASAGAYLQADEPGEQRASFVFDGADGVYDIGFGYFDENDGQSMSELSVNGVVVDSFTWDVDGGGSIANGSSFVERPINGVMLRDGDEVTISGFEDGGEPLRTDYLHFTYVGSAGPDTTAPVVQSVDAPNVGAADAGTTATVVTVTYADDVALDVATVDVTDISVTGPGGALTVTGASVAPSSDGTPRTVNYTVAAPDGTWDPVDDGSYDVALAAGAVADTSGNAIVADPSLASFTVSTGSDTIAPVVQSVDAPNVGAADAGTTATVVTVTYADDVALDVATVDVTDISVTGPGGALTVTGASVAPSSDGTPRTVNYTVAAPDGTWDPVDDGSYDVALAAGAVADTSGNAIAADPSLASFTVLTTAPPPVSSFRVEAETLTLTAGFGIGSNGAASGGQVISSTESGLNTAEYVFTATDGRYDISIGHFDETDGISSLGLFVNAIEIETWLWDSTAGSALGNADSFLERLIEDVTLRNGDLVELRGTSDGGEPLRTDYLDFTYVSAAGADTVAPVIVSADAPDVAFADAGTPETVVTVTYADDVALDVATVDVTDISVTGPGGALTVTGASVDQPSDGTPRTVSYTVAAPGGTWDPADDGAYDVALAAGAVADTSGNAIAADPALASFAVSTTPPPPAPFRVEAETLTIEQGFEVAGNGNASAGAYLQADEPGEQRASFVFDRADGVYDIGLGYFDETDGQSMLQLSVNGVVVDDFVWDVDAGGSVANGSSFVERPINGVTLRDGDEVAISGFEDGGEPLRVDYFDFVYDSPL